LVGPNGAGKTTLFKMISGEENPDTGQVAKPERVTVGYFSQNNEEMKGRTALEEVKAANPKLNLVQERLKDLEANFLNLWMKIK
jgi:ATP-binding cassette subfamily F protein 3